MADNETGSKNERITTERDVIESGLSPGFGAGTVDAGAGTSSGSKSFSSSGSGHAQEVGGLIGNDRSSESSSSGSVYSAGGGTGQDGAARDSQEEMKQKAQDIAGQTKQKAQEIADQTKQQGRAMFDQQKESAAGQMDSVAKAFRSTAQQLEGEGQQQTGKYVGMVAENLESLGRRLKEKNIDELLSDAQNLARRSPATFIAGSIAAGFILSRFLKSSAARQDEQTGYQSSRRTSYPSDEYSTNEYSGHRAHQADWGHKESDGVIVGQDRYVGGSGTLSGGTGSTGGSFANSSEDESRYGSAGFPVRSDSPLDTESPTGVYEDDALKADRNEGDKRGQLGSASDSSNLGGNSYGNR